MWDVRSECGCILVKTLKKKHLGFVHLCNYYVWAVCSTLPVFLRFLEERNGENSGKYYLFSRSRTRVLVIFIITALRVSAECAVLGTNDLVSICLWWAARFFIVCPKTFHYVSNCLFQTKFNVSNIVSSNFLDILFLCYHIFSYYYF